MDKIRTQESDANNNDSIPDSNLNNKSYSLRPRSSVKPGIGVIDEDSASDWRPRGRTKRRQKQKPPPLSKYRRKTANARERSRMREINEAFESLRRAIPHLTQENNHNEKMTKITTLRLAMKYIAALTQVLQDPEPESDLDSAEYTLSLTPTSISDNSDLYDQFLISSSDPLSSSSSSLSITTTSSTNFSNNSLLLRTSNVPNSGTFFPSPCYTLTPPDTSTSLIDIREHCLTPSDFQTDFDSLASPTVDFDDFFSS
ncbi:uncharacterized protein LOC142330852 [Lycorma delicatula]|uniref:uncharacterized protein LOC142330852 n=1 Tax=Lycorma delicatula TaxID=130591 RepID=UPI003F5175D0